MSDGKDRDNNNEEEEEFFNKKVVNGSLDQTENLIRDALKSFIREKYTKRSVDNDIEAMVATCSEFMKCFVIMGYDFKGNSIKPIFYAKNDKDADALNQYVQKFIIQSLH